MELLLCALPLAYTKFLANRTDTIILLSQKIIKFFLFLLKCLVMPFLKLQFFKKRMRLPAIKNNLLLLSAVEVARKIRTKEISSEEVIKIYIERCKEVNPILNAIVESRFEAAIQEARKVDEFLAKTDKNEEELARETPLLGIPITVKQSIAVKGMPYAVGVKSHSSMKATQDAPIVSMVRNAGAIVLLISNTPELCLFWETRNKLQGATWNPYDTRKTSGGSSGGEAALLASAASIVGLTSDISGSTRLPALYCGIYGHKPTPYLVPCEGHKPESSDKIWPNYFAMGTMVRYAEDLNLMMKVISQPEEARHRFDQKVSMKDIKFYYLENCCGVTDSISKDLQRAIQRLRAYILATYGVKVQKAQLNDMKFAFEISTHLMMEVNVDGVFEVFNYTGLSKILLELLKYLFFMSPYTFPVIIYSLTKCIINKFPRSFRQRLEEKKMNLKNRFEELLGNNGVLIFPTFVSGTIYPYESYYNIGNFMYMAIYNALGLPVTQCPLGFNKNGLPIGVQIIANPHCDNLSIAVAEEIGKAFGGWQQPPSIELETSSVP